MSAYGPDSVSAALARSTGRATRSTALSSPSAATLARIVASAGRRLSTIVARAAPRESASMARAPVPAKRSSTANPSIEPSIENTASRTFSDVGRVA